MSRFSSLMIAGTFFVLAACGIVQQPGATGNVGSETDKRLSANDLQGTPLALSQSYTGACVFHNKEGGTSSNCQATMTVAQDTQQIGLALQIGIDNGTAEVATGSFRISGNQLEDQRGNLEGSIGSGGVQVSGNSFQSMSVRQMSDGSVGVLVTQIPNMPGSANGAAFTAVLKASSTQN